MELRRGVVLFAGVVQCALSVLTIVLAGLLYFNLVDAQGLLDVTQPLRSLLVAMLFVFGSFSGVSGGFLLYEWLEPY